MKKVKCDEEKKFFRRSDGVTILEVLIALALFAVIITPVMSTFVTSIRVNQKSRETMIATDVATAIMEGISGKTYEEVVAALDASRAGFVSNITAEGSNAALAFSSINDNWYNKGGADHVDPKCLTEAAPATTGDYPGCYPATITGTSLADNRFPDNVDDQVMCAAAITGVGLTGAGTALINRFDPSMVYEDYILPENKGDKILYFGFSYYGDRTDTNVMFPDVTGKKSYPKAAYMVYGRIEAENHFYDATVTFIPKAQNHDERNNSTADDFFSYEVTVKVYEYHFDPTTHLCVGRFGAGGFDGAPAAVLKGGILRKAINE